MLTEVEQQELAYLEKEFGEKESPLSRSEQLELEALELDLMEEKGDDLGWGIVEDEPERTVSHAPEPKAVEAGNPIPEDEKLVESKLGAPKPKLYSPEAMSLFEQALAMEEEYLAGLDKEGSTEDDAFDAIVDEEIENQEFDEIVDKEIENQEFDEASTQAVKLAALQSSFNEKIDNNDIIPYNKVLKSKYFLGGKKAVKKVEELEGKLTDLQEYVVELEGFVGAPYYDGEGVVTAGVGQTGEYINKSFKQSFDAHVKELKGYLPDYDNYPDYLKKELVQAVYRGDIQVSPKFRKLMKAGKYKEAAKEFLNGRKDYRKSKAKNGGVAKRMDAVVAAVKKYGKENADEEA